MTHTQTLIQTQTQLVHTQTLTKMMYTKTQTQGHTQIEGKYIILMHKPLEAPSGHWPQEQACLFKDDYFFFLIWNLLPLCFCFLRQLLP